MLIVGFSFTEDATDIFISIILPLCIIHIYVLPNAFLDIAETCAVQFIDDDPISNWIDWFQYRRIVADFAIMLLS